MIGKILKSGSFAGKVDYVLRVKNDHKIFTLDTWKVLGSDGLMGEKRNQIIASFEAQAMQNQRIGKPARHITLSFSEEDKPRLTDDFMLKIAKDYLRMMHMQNTQWLIVRHYETTNPHCHIVFNMVDNRGKRLAAGRNRYCNKKVLEELNKRYRLAKPKNQHPEIEKLHGIDRAIAEIRIAAKAALKSAKSWDEFNLLLSKYNVTTEFKNRKGTKIPEGIRFQTGDFKVKGSAIGDEFKFSKLDAYFESFKPKEKQPKTQVRAKAKSADHDSGINATLNMAKETASFANETTSGLASATASAVGDLFQLGSGFDPDAEREARELMKKRKRRTPKLHF